MLIKPDLPVPAPAREVCWACRNYWEISGLCSQCTGGYKRTNPCWNNFLNKLFLVVDILLYSRIPQLCLNQKSSRGCPRGGPRLPAAAALGLTNGFCSRTTPIQQRAAQLASPSWVWRMQEFGSTPKSFSQEWVRCYLLKIGWKSFLRHLFPVACHKSRRNGWDAGKRLFVRLQGFPAAQQDFGMDTTQQPWQGGVWSPWGAWAWAPQGIRWCHPIPVTGGWLQAEGTGLSLWEAGKGNYDFFVYWQSLSGFLCEQKATYLLQKLSTGKSEIPASSRRLLELPEEGLGILHQAEEKRRHSFCSASAPEMGKLFWLKLLVKDCGGKSTDNRCSLCKI